MTQKPLILSAETSSRIGSVALAIGGKLLAEATFSAPLKHSSEIFPSISHLLSKFGGKPCQIEHLYISIGPGSFTGLRITTALAKIMHLANAVKIITVSTLDVIAANISGCINGTYQPDVVHSELKDTSVADDSEASESVRKIAAILDAKRGQFFVAVYERNTNEEQQAIISKTWKKVVPDSIMSAPEFLDQFASRENPVWLLGDGLVYYRDKFQSEGTRFFEQKYWSPRASNVHLLGWEMARRDRFAEPISMTPAYLCRPDVKIKTR